MKQFKIKHDKEFTYHIKKLKAWEWMNMLCDISQCIVSTDKFKAESLVAALHTIGSTGVTTEHSKDTDTLKVLEYANNNTVLFIYEVVRQALTELDEGRRYKIFSAALNAVSFDNGSESFGGGIVPISLDTIDNYIQSPLDLPVLVKEVLMYNYEPIFKSFFKKK